MVPVHLLGVDPTSHNTVAASVIQENGHAGLVTFTEDLHIKTITQKLALNSDFGLNLGQDGRFTGTPSLIHDGIDATAWTGSSVSGTKVTFDSTAQSHAGSASIEVDNPGVGNTWQFDNGSVFNVNGFTSISGECYVDKDWSAGDSVSVFGYDTSLGVVLGNPVFLENYISVATNDVWQSFNISLEDLGLTGATTLDAVRMSHVAKGAGKSPKFYLDELNFQEGGGGIIFSIEPSIGSVFYITDIKTTITDAHDISLVNGTAPGLNHKTLLGVAALDNGIITRGISAGQTTFQQSLRSLGDLMTGSSTMTDVLCDGTETLVSINANFNGFPIVLTQRTGDRIEYIVQDDLRGLDRYIIVASGYELVDHTIRAHNSEDSS